MTENGYVKLYRRMVKWGWYDEPFTKAVFLHILLCANFDDSEYRGYQLHAGDAVIGRKKMAVELGMSEQQVRTALEHLQKSGEITIKSTNKFSIVTVEKWAHFQGYDDDDNQQINQQLTNEQPTTNQQVTNNQPTSNHTKRNKEIKKNKEIKNIRNIYSGFPVELREALDGFVDMRNKIKKPLTERALGLALKNLNQLSNGDTAKAINIVNQSVLHNWQSFYELKENKSSGDDVIRRMLEEEYAKERMA